MNLRERFTNTNFLSKYTFVLVILVYAAGMFVPILQDDASVYAEISREMYVRANYLEIFRNGVDWLDKPHFQFWVTALSFKFFGVSEFTYKLPGVLFTFIAVCFTYLFAAKFYSRLHGFIAALILITAQHIIISANDVRAEPFLTCFTIMSLYFFAQFIKNKKIINIIAGSAALACLMMTKGLFTIIPIVCGIGFALLYEKKWKEIFDWRWILAGIFTFIFMMPTLYGYYYQFDLHPEKVVFGQHGVSGVKFFLWTSQWGRFTNTGPIVKKDGSIFYFIHTLLWAFAPWAIIGYFALANKTKQLIKKVSDKENYTFFGFISLFIIFSLSRFQLSFYLNLIFPLLAILCTDTILSLRNNTRLLKILTVVQLVTIIALLIAACTLHFLFFDHAPSIDTLIIFLSAVLISAVIFLTKGNWLKKIIFAPAIILLSVNYYVNRDFYPALIPYQSENTFVNYVKQNNIPLDKIAILNVMQTIINFHLRTILPDYKLEDVTANDLKGKLVFTTDAGMEKIRSLNLQPQIITIFKDFHISTLKGDFINKKTREQTLTNRYFVKVN